MVRQAVDGWPAFADITLRLLPKGSYANNTNVRQDSDVDIAVIHQGFRYFNDAALTESDRITRRPVTIPHLDGGQLRLELERCMTAKFGRDCDTSGSTAITIREGSARVSADVVPSFIHFMYHYDKAGRVSYHKVTTTRRTDGSWVINYPEQQMANGIAKNERTGGRYKDFVRILKRVENDLAVDGKLDELPSYLMECLGYCVPDTSYGHGGSTPLTDDAKAALYHIWEHTKDGGAAAKWLEPNGAKELFADSQKWTMKQAHELAYEAWNHLGLGDS
jgi:hypothetical protein